MLITKYRKKHFSADKRLEVIKLADKLGNVSEACKIYKMDRASFYRWQKRYQADNILSLENKKKPIGTHPLKIKLEITEQIVNLSLSNPTWGCVKISEALKSMGINISSPTIQKKLQEKSLGTMGQRLIHLEKLYINDDMQLPLEQLELIRKYDPPFREFNKVGKYPGDVLVQDTFPIFNILPKTYIHVVIDTFSSYAFAYPWTEKSADLAIDLFEGKVRKFFAQRKLSIRKVLTDRGYEFTRYGEKYTKYLLSKGIEHQIYLGNEKNWNGFIESYKKLFFERYTPRIQSASNANEVAEAIQRMKADYISATRIIEGYPNFGISPAKLINKSNYIKII